MHGSSDEAFGASFRQIAQLVHLPPSYEDQDTLLKTVKSWFETPASGSWTIVIDNLDDIALQSRHYIPVRHGEILFTTRDKRIIGHPSLVPAGAGIEVSRMSDEEAMAAFCRIVGSEEPLLSPATGPLLSLLDGLPLAIAQAATYIRATHMPIANYLSLFQKSEEHQQTLLSEPLPAALGNDENDVSRAVMTTWALTVQKIEQESPLSIELLQIISFLDPDNLPSSFIEAVLSAEKENHFKQLAPLLNFGLLTCLESSNYRLHRLVSMWARVKMSPEVKHQCIDQGIVLMSRCFPSESFHSVTKYMGMLPHALSILDHVASGGSKFGSELSWELQGNVIDFLRGIGQRDLAMKYARLSLSQEKVFEQDESKRYISGSRLGEIYQSMAEYATAINEYRQALDGLEMTLGKNHPNTLATVDKMAGVFRDKGEYDKALEWYQRALDGKEIALGKDHPDTLATVNNMAMVYRHKGEYGKALSWYQRALDGREMALGKDHPDTLGTVNNMAMVFQDKGEYDKARSWYQRALDGAEMSLGKDHPNTLGTVNNMAMVFQRKGQYDKALKWYQRALDGKEMALGKDHPDTLGIVHNMAIVFLSQGEYDKALEWYQRALDGNEMALGKDHPDTLATVNNMATVFRRKGEYDKALEWYQRALSGNEMALGKDHPNTLGTVNNMAMVSQDQGEYGKALEWYQRALDGREKTLGMGHPSTIATAKNIAKLRNLSNSKTPSAPGPHQETRSPRSTLLPITRVLNPWKTKRPKPT